MVIDKGIFAVFYMMTLSYASTIDEDAFFFPVYSFSFFFKNQGFIGVWFDFKFFTLFPLVHLSGGCFYAKPGLFFFLNYVSIVELDGRDDDVAGSSLIIQDCFSCPVFFMFPYGVEYCSFEFCV